MKKILTLILALIMCFGMVACGGTSNNEPSEPPKPLNLTGTWVQTNANSEDSWMEAVISEDYIEITWIFDNGDTKSLYWAGSYDAPTEATDEYAWVSNNDTEQTSFALLASPDETKDFSYSNGELSFEASALGTTMVVRMEMQE